MYCSVLPSISPCLIPTTTVRERRQGAIVTGGGPSGVLRPLAGASESVNQCDLGIGTERGVTFGDPARIDGSLCKTALIRIERVCKPREGQTRKLSAVSSSPVIAEKWNPETKVISAF